MPLETAQLLGTIWIFPPQNAAFKATYEICRLRGIVVDSQDRPVPNAQVVVNQGTRSQTGTSGGDGIFSVAGCKPGASQIWTKANGLAQAAVLMNITNSQAPLRIVLKPGKMLRLRFVAQTGSPFSNAEVRLHSPVREFSSLIPSSGPRITLFDGHTDADGWIVWADAPDVKMVPDISATGYLQPSDVSVKADGMDYVITLQTAPPIGTVSHDWANPVWHGSVQNATPDGPILERP